MAVVTKEPVLFDAGVEVVNLIRPHLGLKDVGKLEDRHDQQDHEGHDKGEFEQGLA